MRDFYTGKTEAVLINVFFLFLLFVLGWSWKHLLRFIPSCIRHKFARYIYSSLEWQQRDEEIHNKRRVLNLLRLHYSNKPLFLLIIIKEERKYWWHICKISQLFEFTVILHRYIEPRNRTTTVFLILNQSTPRQYYLVL